MFVQSEMKGTLMISISLAIMALGCKILNSQDDYIYGKIYVDELVADDTVKSGQIFTVKILGYLPDPAWKVFKSEIKELKNEIQITPLARRQKNVIAPQVITPCSTSVELVSRAVDSLKVLVIGRDRTLEKIIKIIP